MELDEHLESRCVRNSGEKLAGVESGRSDQSTSANDGPLVMLTPGATRPNNIQREL